MGNSETKLPSEEPSGQYQAALEDPMGPPIKIGSHAPGGRPPLAPEQRSIIFKKTGKKKTKSRLQLLKHTADKTKQEHFRDGKIIHIDELINTVREKTEEVVERARNFGSNHDNSNYSGGDRGMPMSRRMDGNNKHSAPIDPDAGDGDVEDSIDLEAEARAHAEAEAQVSRHYYPQATRPTHVNAPGTRSLRGGDKRGDDDNNDDDWVDVALFDH
jgi:Arc/MetJ family transcription regulator